IGQPADPPGNRYFDPVLQHNGRPERFPGYCSDVFTDATIRFVTEKSDRPFFAYLAFNCPHEPLQVPERYEQPYSRLNLAHDQFPKVGFPPAGAARQGDIARIYGMVTNIDDNVGRLLEALDRHNLAQNTVVIFMSDNGPQQPRYNGGLRGLKGTVY